MKSKARAEVARVEQQFTGFPVEDIMKVKVKMDFAEDSRAVFIAEVEEICEQQKLICLDSLSRIIALTDIPFCEPPSKRRKQSGFKETGKGFGFEVSGKENFAPAENRLGGAKVSLKIHKLKAQRKEAEEDALFQQKKNENAGVQNEGHVDVPSFTSRVHSVGSLQSSFQVEPPFVAEKNVSSVEAQCVAEKNVLSVEPQCAVETKVLAVEPPSVAEANVLPVQPPCVVESDVLSVEPPYAVETNVPPIEKRVTRRTKKAAEVAVTVQQTRVTRARAKMAENGGDVPSIAEEEPPAKKSRAPRRNNKAASTSPASEVGLVPKTEAIVSPIVQAQERQQVVVLERWVEQCREATSFNKSSTLGGNASPSLQLPADISPEKDAMAKLSLVNGHERKESVKGKDGERTSNADRECIGEARQSNNSGISLEVDLHLSARSENVCQREVLLNDTLIVKEADGINTVETRKSSPFPARIDALESRILCSSSKALQERGCDDITLLSTADQVGVSCRNELGLDGHGGTAEECFVEQSEDFRGGIVAGQEEPKANFAIELNVCNEESIAPTGSDGNGVSHLDIEAISQEQDREKTLNPVGVEATAVRNCTPVVGGHSVLELPEFPHEEGRVHLLRSPEGNEILETASKGDRLVPSEGKALAGEHNYSPSKKDCDLNQQREVSGEDIVKSNMQVKFNSRNHLLVLELLSGRPEVSKSKMGEISARLIADEMDEQMGEGQVSLPQPSEDVHHSPDAQGMGVTGVVSKFIRADLVRREGKQFSTEKQEGKQTCQTTNITELVVGGNLFKVEFMGLLKNLSGKMESQNDSWRRPRDTHRQVIHKRKEPAAKFLDYTHPCAGKSSSDQEPQQGCAANSVEVDRKQIKPSTATHQASVDSDSKIPEGYHDLEDTTIRDMEEEVEMIPRQSYVDQQLSTSHREGRASELAEGCFTSLEYGSEPRMVGVLSENNLELSALEQPADGDVENETRNRISVLFADVEGGCMSKDLEAVLAPLGSESDLDPLYKNLSLRDASHQDLQAVGNAVDLASSFTRLENLTELSETKLVVEVSVSENHSAKHIRFLEGAPPLCEGNNSPQLKLPTMEGAEFVNPAGPLTSRLPSATDCLDEESDLPEDKSILAAPETMEYSKRQEEETPLDQELPGGNQNSLDSGLLVSSTSQLSPPFKANFAENGSQIDTSTVDGPTLSKQARALLERGAGDPHTSTPCRLSVVLSGCDLDSEALRYYKNPQASSTKQSKKKAIETVTDICLQTTHDAVSIRTTLQFNKQCPKRPPGQASSLTMPEAQRLSEVCSGRDMPKEDLERNKPTSAICSTEITQAAAGSVSMSGDSPGRSSTLTLLQVQGPSEDCSASDSLVEEDLRTMKPVASIDNTGHAQAVSSSQSCIPKREALSQISRGGLGYIPNNRPVQSSNLVCTMKTFVPALHRPQASYMPNGRRNENMKLLEKVQAGTVMKSKQGVDGQGRIRREALGSNRSAIQNAIRKDSAAEEGVSVQSESMEASKQEIVKEGAVLASIKKSSLFTPTSKFNRLPGPKSKIELERARRLEGEKRRKESAAEEAVGLQTDAVNASKLGSTTEGDEFASTMQSVLCSPNVKLNRGPGSKSRIDIERAKIFEQEKMQKESGVHDEAVAVKTASVEASKQESMKVRGGWGPSAKPGLFSPSAKLRSKLKVDAEKARKLEEAKVRKESAAEKVDNVQSETVEVSKQESLKDRIAVAPSVKSSFFSPKVRSKLRIDTAKKIEEEKRRQESKRRKPDTKLTAASRPKRAMLHRREQQEEKRRRPADSLVKLRREQENQLHAELEEKGCEEASEEQSKVRMAKLIVKVSGEQVKGRLGDSRGSTRPQTAPSQAIPLSLMPIDEQILHSGTDLLRGKSGNLVSSGPQTPKAALLVEDLGPMSYEISPYRESSDDEAEEKQTRKPRKHIPVWVKKDNLKPQLLRQLLQDPDEIFAGSNVCILKDVFGTTGSKKVLDFSNRSGSGDWVNDRVSWKEELQYKISMGYMKNSL